MTDPHERFVLGIDLGTSGPKVALMTAAGEVRASEFRAVDVILSPGGGAEQDPAAWWGAIVEAARAVLQSGGIPVDQIGVVTCTTQWSGTVPVDEGGRALGNAIIWMDSRGGPYMRAVTSRGLLKADGYGLLRALNWVRLTGGLPSHAGKDPTAHILFLKHERPAVYAAAHKFLEPRDYLNARLTGRMVTSADAITLHWVTDNRDSRNVAYHDGLLRMVGIERAKLPEIVPVGSLLGPIVPAVAAELGLAPGTQVHIGTPDLHSAAVGSGAVEDFVAHLYLGTSSWMICHVPFKKTDMFHNLGAIPAAIPGRYIVANEQETAGACLSLLRDRLLCPVDAVTPAGAPAGVYQSFDELAAAAPPGCNGMIFTPWLYGERTPIADHTVRGGFFNLGLDATRGTLIRSVLEGVAFNARWTMVYLEKMVGRRLDPIHLIGGGARSALWCQICADVLDRPIAQVRDPIHANLRGAGLLAAAAMGYVPYAALGSRVPLAATYQPNRANRALYDELFAVYVKLYERLRPLYARLNGRRAPARSGG